MDEQPQLNQNQTPVATPPSFQAPNQMLPQQPAGDKSKILVTIVCIIVVVLLAAAFGTLYAMQTSRAKEYLVKAREFGSSEAVRNLGEGLDTFNKSDDGLYKDMYLCKASAAQIISAGDVATKELEVRKKYSDASAAVKQNAPGEFKSLPLVGSFGKSSEARKASKSINELVTSVEQLTGPADGYGGYTGNEYAQYCLRSIYTLLSNHLAFLQLFSDEATLARYFKDGTTYAQDKLDQLTLFESYGHTPPSGFEDVDKVRSEYLSAVRGTLEGLLTTEKEHKGDVLYLGYKYTDFANHLKAYDDSLIAQASRLAAERITLDIDKLEASIDAVRELADVE